MAKREIHRQVRLSIDFDSCRHRLADAFNDLGNILEKADVAAMMCLYDQMELVDAVNRLRCEVSVILAMCGNAKDVKPVEKELCYMHSGIEE